MTPRGSALALAILALGVYSRPSQAAFNLAIGPVSSDSALVRLDFRLDDPLPDPEADGSLVSPPAALAYTIELWRDRSTWFDALVSQRTYGYRLEVDRVRRVYRVAVPDSGVIETADREELVRLLTEQVAVAAARLDDLSPGKHYYLAVTARLTPIDLDKLEDVNAWLSGDIRPRNKGGVLGVPKSVVGFLADVAGLGDKAAISRSARFHREVVAGASRLVIEVEDE
ncbi:MAG TPA: DUF4390 domain-containing protein [Candidatus Eisenbacteria bacterium]